MRRSRFTIDGSVRAMNRSEASDTSKRREKGKATIGRIASLFRPHLGEVGVMLCTVLAGVLLGLLAPFFLKIIIDEGLARNDIGVTSIYSALTIVATLAAASVTLLYGYQSVKIGQKIMCEMRTALFSHLLRMSLRFFTGTRTGEIQTRLISDMEGVQNVICTSLVDALSNLAIVITCLIAMLFLDWRLTVLSIIFVPIIGFSGQWVGRFAREVRRGIQEQTAEVNSMTQENLSVSGAVLGKTIGRIDVLVKDFDIENRKLAAWQIKSAVQQYIYFGIFRTITQIIPAIVYWFAGWMLHRGDPSISVGTLVAFTMLQARMFFPLTGLMSLQFEIFKSFALFDRIFEYLDMPLDVADRPGARALAPDSTRGAVTFESVGFRYEREGASWTLRDVSLHAEPGQLIALVGPSGAGKTTLTYLIPRLYDVDSGSIKIDGVDVRDLKLEGLQRTVGVVTQETYLLHATIKANLRIANPEATDAQLIEACRTAAIHDHIANLPEGYDTVVGERGYKLSGGEKQRLAIARALLKDPKILILDEATSALDTHSERLIQASLGTLMQGRTTFAIAHRLSTIENADVILVIERGRITERGTHKELLKAGGRYAALRAAQHGDGARSAEDTRTESPLP